MKFMDEMEWGGAMHSEYSSRARNRLRVLSEENPDMAKDAMMALHVQREIHREAGKEFFVYRGMNASEVCTKVSVLTLVGGNANPSIKKKLGELMMDRFSVNKEMWCIFSSAPDVTRGLKLLPNDGSLMTAFDMAMDRAVISIPKIVAGINEGKLLDVELRLFGSPYNTGGTVSHQYIERMREIGSFRAVAELHAEQIASELKSNQNIKVVLTGHSYGATQAAFVSQYLEDFKDRVKVIADAPTVAHGGDSREKRKDEIVSEEGSHMVKGVITATVNEAKNRLMDITAKFYLNGRFGGVEREYRKWLEKARIQNVDDPDQVRLKKSALEIVVSDLAVGPLRENEKTIFSSVIPTHIRMPANDETLSEQTRRRMIDNLPGSARIYNLTSRQYERHAIDRHRYNRWINAARWLGW